MHRRPLVESLERRALLTAVSGVVFNDFNANGIKDPGEPAPNVALAYVDLNNDNAFQSGEPWDHTDSSGLFLISGLTTGQTYTVRVSGSFSEIPTVPAQGGGYTFVAPALGEIASGYMFGTYSTWQNVRIMGNVFDDLNGNGAYDAFEWAEGHTVWLDKNDDGTIDTGEPSAVTNVFGNFTFENLFNPNVPTDYVLRIKPKTGYAVTLPTDSRYVVTADPGTWARADNAFAVRQAGSISGTVKLDIAADGPTGEWAPLGNVRVYVDQNGNESFDASEPSSITGLAGGFKIEGLVAGSYTVRVDVPDVFFQTYGGAPTITLAPGQHYYHLEFGLDAYSSSAHVYQFRDINLNGVRDTDEPLEPGKDVFWDLNENGTYEPSPTDWPAFPGTVDGETVYRIEVPLGEQRFSIRPEGGKRVTTSTGYVTGVATEVNGVFVVEVPYQSFATISGRTYNDNNANGVFDAGDTIISRTVFLDTDNDGQLDAGERTTVSGADGTFTFNDVTPGEYDVRRVFPKGYKASNPPREYVITGGEAITGADIGSVTSGTVVTPPGETPPPAEYGSISGVLYNDNNANGVYDTGDTPISRVVYLDTNNNGKLDSGEKSVTSGSDGKFTFTNLTAGDYRVRRAFPSGYKPSNPVRDYVLTAGQVITGADIGSVKSSTTVTPPGGNPPPTGETGSISGFLFWDADRDGAFDSGEDYQSGKTVFIDLDDDNILDSNETRLTTDSQGRFTFSGLDAGTYIVKRVVPKGYAMTTPKQSITLATGQIFSGVAIGTNTN